MWAIANGSIQFDFGVVNKMNTRAIILCAGEATRWANYLNTPKHLVEIEGERILDRTVRLLRAQGVRDIHVVVKSDDLRYRIPGSRLYVASVDYELNADADKFLSSRVLWNGNGRTLVIYGDCYFTEEAIEAIVSEARIEWLLFCRPFPSALTGTPWGECFAQSFYPQHLARHEEALHRIARLYKSGRIKRCGGWEHYNAMIGRSDEDLEQCRPDGTYTMLGNYVEINDWSEDFDFPEDYILWRKRRSLSRIQSRPGSFRRVKDFWVRLVTLTKLYSLRFRRSVGWSY